MEAVPDAWPGERGRESAELKPPWTPLCSVEGGRGGGISEEPRKVGPGE
jgi:hypothetical protein